MIAAQQLKGLRIKNNYTQEYLATTLKISQKTYSNLESGKSKINLDHLHALAAIYKLELLALVTLLTRATPATMEQLHAAHQETSTYDLYNGINKDLTHDLLQEQQRQIDQLVYEKKELEKRLELFERGNV